MDRKLKDFINKYCKSCNKKQNIYKDKKGNEHCKCNAKNCPVLIPETKSN